MRIRHVVTGLNGANSHVLDIKFGDTDPKHANVWFNMRNYVDTPVTVMVSTVLIDKNGTEYQYDIENKTLQANGAIISDINKDLLYNMIRLTPAFTEGDTTNQIDVTVVSEK